ARGLAGVRCHDMNLDELCEAAKALPHAIDELALERQRPREVTAYRLDVQMTKAGDVDAYSAFHHAMPASTSCLHPPDFPNIGAMRRRAADGVANVRVDRQIEVGAVRTEGIAMLGAQFIASLPPAMLADDDARVEPVAEARPRPHSAGRGAHVDPISICDAARGGRRGIELDLRIQRALAQG